MAQIPLTGGILEVPTLKDLSNHVVPEVDNKWYVLGLQLLDSKDTKVLSSIESDNRGLVETCCIKMFDRWLSTVATANWDRLITGLKAPSVKLHKLADTLVKQLGVQTGLNESHPIDHLQQGYHSSSHHSSPHGSFSYHSTPSGSPELSRVPQVVEPPDDYVVEFSILVVKISEIIQNKSTTTDLDGIKHALELVTVNKMSTQPLFSDSELEMIKKSKNVFDIIEKCRKHWSWSSYSLLELIVKKSGSDEAKQELRRFQKVMNIRQKIKDLGDNLLQDLKKYHEGYESLMVVLDEYYDDITVHQLEEAEKFLSRVILQEETCIDESVQQFYNYLDYIKKNEKHIDVQHLKIFLTGSASAGKTSFRHLLLNFPFCENQMSTDVLEARLAYAIHNSASLLQSEGDETIWYQLTPKQQIIYFKSLLDDCYHAKSNKSNQHAKDFRSNPSSNKSTNDGDDKDNDNAIIPDAPSILEEKLIQSDVLPEGLHIGKIVKIIIIIDTGGQPGYVHLLPAIVNHPTINFIVHDMTKELEEPVLVRYKKEGQDEIKPYKLNYTNKDLIKLTMSLSTESLCLSPTHIKNTSNFISFVGTHKDKIEDSKRSQRILILNEQLSNIIKQQNCKVEILNTGIGDDSVLFAVDNTTAGKGKDEDKTVKEIRRKIEKVMQEMPTYPLPITWMIIELELQELRSIKNVSYITFEEYSNIARNSASVENEENIKKSLRYFNFLEVLLYFEDIPGLCDYVIIDQQWLYNKVSMFVHLPSELISCTRDSSQKLYKTSGMLLKDECRNIKWKEDIQIEHFISFLIYKNIIVEFTMVSKQYYYLPYILPPCHQYYDKNQFLLSEPLLIQFSNGVLPRGFFCSLAVHLLQKLPDDWQHDLLSSTDKRFINVMTFRLPDDFYLRMQDRVYYLELQIRHYKDNKLENAFYHSKVVSTLQTYLKEVCKQLKFDHGKLQYGFLCHDRNNTDDDHIAIIPSIENQPSKLYCNRKCKNPTIISSFHAIWFDKWRTDGTCVHPTVVTAESVDQTAVLSTNSSASRKSCHSESIDKIMRSKPEMWDIMKIVLPQIKSEWKYVATSLRYPPADVKAFEKDSHDVKECCYNLFTDWLSTNRGVTPKTWGRLIERIEDVDNLQDAVKKIKEEVAKLEVSSDSL